MKKTGLVIVVALLSLLGLDGRAMAAPSVHLNWGSEVNPARRPTDENYRYLVLNVTHHVTNDGDSGLTRFWATDDYNQHIQVWEVGEQGEEGELFCVIVKHQGSFTTTAGSSPAGTDPNIAAGIEGTFEGGYRAAVVGTLNSNPILRTRGNIGTFNFGWDGHPDHGAHTPFDWLSIYFNSVSSINVECGDGSTTAGKMARGSTQWMARRAISPTDLV